MPEHHELPVAVVLHEAGRLVLKCRQQFAIVQLDQRNTFRRDHFQGGLKLLRLKKHASI